jgi:hypothetical protein
VDRAGNVSFVQYAWSPSRWPVEPLGPGHAARPDKTSDQPAAVAH